VERSDTQAVIDVMKEFHHTELRQIPGENSGGAPVFIVPKGMHVQDAKPFLDLWLQRPRRLIGTAKAETLQSFCALVNQHKTADTVIFASVEKRQLVAVIDYHGESDGEDISSQPSFCEHRIEYNFPLSPEFKAWETSQWRTQGAFARYLDVARFDLLDPLDTEPVVEGTVLYDVLYRMAPRDKRGDLDALKPTVFASPGDLMQLVESLSGHSKTKFAEVKTDRFGGMRATIEKEGRVESDERIPSLFIVQVSAFVGGDKLALPARIRAKVEGDKLAMCAELIGIERVLEGAFVGALEEVKATTGCKVFRGTPEA
jgi:hypothetical protein